MPVYAGKPTRNEDAEITGFENIIRVGPQGYISRVYRKLYSNVDTKFPKAVFNDPDWTIEHDQIAQDAHDLKTSDNASMLDKAQRAKKRLKADLAKIDTATVSQIRPMVKDLIRTALYLIREIEEK